MARCDEGYQCDVCGKPVEEIDESDLYLRYVLGEVVQEALPNAPERHIRCHPVQAQFIVDADFAAVQAEGVFDKRTLDAVFVKNEERRMTQAWRRLREVVREGIPLDEYPLG